MASLDFMNPLGDMVSLIGSTDFGSRFYNIVNGILGIDHCTVFILRGDNPTTLVAEAQSDLVSQRVRSLAHNYVKVGFRSDPIWGIGGGDASGCNAFLLSPTELHDERYREEFYIGPNIQHELALTAAIGNDRIYAAFYRENGRRGFDQESIDRLRYCGRPMLQVLQKQNEMALALQTETPGKPADRKELMVRVRAAILADNSQITPREAEICACIVLGYTVLGIGLNLGISINTVATHRKRAYAKLRISSQNELFARYFSVVERNLGGVPYN